MRPATCTASGADLLRFCERELQAGWPVILGWRQPHPVRWHAALVTGFEGRQNGRTFEPHAVLLLDPAGNEPELNSFNARIDMWGRGKPRFRSGSTVREIRPLGALSIRSVVRSRPPAMISAASDA